MPDSGEEHRRCFGPLALSLAGRRQEPTPVALAAVQAMMTESHQTHQLPVPPLQAALALAEMSRIHCRMLQNWPAAAAAVAAAAPAAWAQEPSETH